MERNTHFGNQWNEAMIEFIDYKFEITSQPMEILKEIPEVVLVNNIYSQIKKEPQPDLVLKNAVLPLEDYLLKRY